MPIDRTYTVCQEGDWWLVQNSNGDRMAADADLDGAIDLAALLVEGSTTVNRAKTPEPPMRRIRYLVTHGLPGYLPESGPAYFTNRKAAISYAWEERKQYLEALGAYDDQGRRYRAGHDNRVDATRYGGKLPSYYMSFGQDGSRHVTVDPVSEADNLFFDSLGDVYAKETTPEGRIAWVEVPQD